MNKRRAKQIIIQILENKKRENIQVHSIGYCSDMCIKAVVSYTWRLNAWQKNVKRIEVEAYLSEETAKWIPLGY